MSKKIKYADIEQSQHDISNWVYDPPKAQSPFGLLPGQGADGYGHKITTEYKVFYKGRLRRIYATCISNAAAYWIVCCNEKLHLRG